MKLELPDNNASVLFHMGNALQSIASDLDVAYNNKTPLRVDTSGMTQDEISDSIDKMIDAVAVDWKVPVNRLTGNVTDAEQYGKSVLGDCLDNVDTLISASDTIDADGLPWDQRIHSRGKTRLADNTWRMARKPNDKTDEEWVEYVEGVKAELKALMAIPVAVTYDPNEDDPFAIEPPVVDAEVVTLPVVIEAPEVVTPPIVIEAPEVVTPPVVIEAPEVVTPPIVIEAPEVVTPVVDAVVTPPVVDAVVTPPVDAAVIAPPVVDAVVTGPTTFPELMKFITVNNKKLTKESVDEALKAQGLASIALLAARTDLIPQVHAALVKLL